MSRWTPASTGSLSASATASRRLTDRSRALRKSPGAGYFGERTWVTAMITQMSEVRTRPRGTFGVPPRRVEIAGADRDVGQVRAHPALPDAEPGRSHQRHGLSCCVASCVEVACLHVRPRQRLQRHRPHRRPRAAVCDDGHLAGIDPSAASRGRVAGSIDVAAR